MEFIGPYGVPAGSPYQQGDAATGVKGSYLDYRALTHPMTEILNVIQAAGITPDDGDLTQLLDAISSMITAAMPSLAAYLLKSGGTMTGALTLSGAPTADLHAATKLFASAKILGNASAGALVLPGGPMIQWATTSPAAFSSDGGTTDVTWYTAFPTACLAAWVQKITSSNVADWWIDLVSKSTTGAQFMDQGVSGVSAGSGTAAATVVSIGY